MDNKTKGMIYNFGISPKYNQHRKLTMKLKKHIVLFLITVFILVTISTLIGCEKQFLITKIDDTKETEKEPIKNNGIGEIRPGSLYTFGTIIIQYDEETWELENKKHTPIKTVNDFLVSKGYTPIVRSILPGRLIEVIDIEKNMDIFPLLRELQTVPGVVAAERSFLDVFESIIIQYDKETWKQANKRHTPIKTVNDFLVSKEYTPKVRGILPGRLIEVIDIEKHVDPLPLLEELHTIPGIVSAELNYLKEHADVLTRGDMPRLPPEPEIITLTPNNVGEIGSKLFELGVLLIAYDHTGPLIPAGASVDAVFQLLFDKGYEPIEKDLLLRIRMQIIYIGENIDPSPLFRELTAITGVSYVRRNFLYESADFLLGTISY